MLFDQLFGNIATQPSGTPSFINGNAPAYSAKPPQQVAGPINPADQRMQAPGPNPQPGFGMPPPTNPNDNGGQPGVEDEIHDLDTSTDDWAAFGDPNQGLPPGVEIGYGREGQEPITPDQPAQPPGHSLFGDLFGKGGIGDIFGPVFGMPPQQPTPQPAQPGLPAWAQGRNISQGPDGLYKDDQGYLLDQSGKTVGTMAHHNDWLRQQQRFADRDRQFNQPQMPWGTPTLF